MNETGIFNMSYVLDGSNHKNRGEKSSKLAQPKESIIAGLHLRDYVFSELWCDRAYKYSTNNFQEQGTGGSNHIANKPWGDDSFAISSPFLILKCFKGVYVTTDDILATSMTSEQLWQEAKVAPTNKAELFERAIALEVTNTSICKTIAVSL